MANENKSIAVRDLVSKLPSLYRPLTRRDALKETRNGFTERAVSAVERLTAVMEVVPAGLEAEGVELHNLLALLGPDIKSWAEDIVRVTAIPDAEAIGKAQVRADKRFAAMTPEQRVKARAFSVERYVQTRTRQNENQTSEQGFWAALQTLEGYRATAVQIVSKVRERATVERRKLSPEQKMWCTALLTGGTEIAELLAE